MNELDPKKIIDAAMNHCAKRIREVKPQDGLVADEAYELDDSWTVVIVPRGVAKGEYTLKDWLPVSVDSYTADVVDISWEDAADTATLDRQRLVPTRPGSLVR